jgi:hypothetical protein
MSHPSFAPTIRALLNTKLPVVGRSFDFSNLSDVETAGRMKVISLFLEVYSDRVGSPYMNDPVSDVFFPSKYSVVTSIELASFSDFSAKQYSTILATTKPWLDF